MKFNKAKILKVFDSIASPEEKLAFRVKELKKTVEDLKAKKPLLPKKGDPGEQGIPGEPGKDGKDGTQIEGEQIIEKINALEITPLKQIDFIHIRGFPWHLVKDQQGNNLISWGNTTLAQALVQGNTTGGTDIVVSDGDLITSDDGLTTANFQTGLVISTDAEAFATPYAIFQTTKIELASLSGGDLLLDTNAATLAHNTKITFNSPIYNFSQLTASTVPYLNASKNLVSSTVTPTELGYLSGVTSALQTQLNAKLTSTLANTNIFVGNVGNVAIAVAMSGDATLANTGALTLATVNANVGTFGSATKASIFTVNAKGLITAASEATITPAVGSITGLGTGVATALAVNVGSAGAFVVNGGALGTPSSGVATNLTGTASGLTAGNVTTNANLTGPITSVGNATSIASQTGTGTTFVMNTAPQVTILGIGTAAVSSQPITTSGSVGAGGAWRISHTNTNSGGFADIFTFNDGGKYNGLQISGSATSATQFGLTSVNYAKFISTGDIFGIGTASNKPLVFGTNDLERMRIDNAGYIGISTAAPDTNLTIITSADSTLGAPFHIKTSSANDVSAFYDRYGGSAGVIYRRVNGTPGSETTVASGNVLSTFQTRAHDGTSFVVANNMRVVVDAAVSTGIVPTRYEFLTMNTAGSLAERVRIDSTGNMGIANTAPLALLHVGAGTTTPSLTSVIYASKTGAAVLTLRDDTNSVELAFGTGFNAGSGYGILGTRTNSTFVLQINGNNRVSVSKTSPFGMLIADDSITTEAAEKLAVVGSIAIGSTGVARGTTAGTNRLDIFNGTAPVGTLTNGVSFYSAGGEPRVMDSLGNITILGAVKAAIDTTGLTANVGTTTMYAVPASGAGMYQVCSLVVETTAGSLSSTLPNVQIVYTDKETGGVITIDATPVLGVAGIGQTGALTANTVGTTSTGVIVINAKASTNIQYLTTNYASNLAGMTYALHIKLEYLG